MSASRQQIKQIQYNHRYNNAYDSHYEEKQIDTNATFTFLSDLNDIIFNDIECNGFILNGHANAEFERILTQINKIYDILFDFLYEAQLRKAQHKRMGFGGRLNKLLIKSILSPLLIGAEILCQFALILNIDMLYSHDYSRDEFNILFRLISMHCNNINQSFMSFLDYQSMIVSLPHIKLPHGFIHYLQDRLPKLNINYGQKARKTESKFTETTQSTMINLNEFEAQKHNKTNDRNEEIFSHLFKFYNGSHEYMSQELAVEMLTSSKLSQEILEMIWNESKLNNDELDEYECDGLNEYEFIISLQLTSLAQQCLPYNKYYLLSYKKIKYICLPSIFIDIAFSKYMKNMKPGKNMNKRYKYKLYNRPLSKLIPYIPTSHIENFMIYFDKMDRKKRGYLSGHVIGRFFRKSQLNESILAKVWDLSDIDNDGKLCAREFCIAMHLINCVRQGAPLPNYLPRSLLSRDGDSNGNKNNTPFTESHLSTKQISSLAMGQYVDFRTENGKYGAMEIVNVSGASINLLDENDIIQHCNYKQDMNRFAKYKSITMRRVTRKNMVSFACGDVVDVNVSNEWKLGVICELDIGQALIQIINDSNMHWVHLDNVFEVAPPNTYTSYTSHTHSSSNYNVGTKKRKKMKARKKSKRENSATNSAGFVMINYPENQSVSHTQQTQENEMNEYHRPVIQFGGTETDKEVQYVLKTLNTSGRKHSYHSLTQNENMNHKPDLQNQQYSNTAPSTPIKLTVKRYKYQARKQKNKSKRDYI